VLERCATDTGTTPDSGAALVQFLQIDHEWVPSTTPVATTDRPPLRDVLSPRA
jgi:glucosyl-3-phosphoglycerate synthase